MKEKTIDKHSQRGQEVVIELSPTKVQQFNKQPAIESMVRVSEDGKWIISKTIITDIKPVAYYDKMLANTKKA